MGVLTGCSSRSLTIRTNPPGSDVYVDGEYAGASPVTLPFTYGGVHEILVYPPKRSPGDPAWKPQRVFHDTTRSAFDVPVIDLAADLSGAEDRQSLDIELHPDNLTDLYQIDGGAGVRSALRARADTLRSRAREFQLSARPPSQGQDPGPLENLRGPASRPAAIQDPAKTPER